MRRRLLSVRRRRRYVLAASIYLQPTPAGRCRIGIGLLVHPLLPPGSSDICDVNTLFREHEGCPPYFLFFFVVILSDDTLSVLLAPPTAPFDVGTL